MVIVGRSGNFGLSQTGRRFVFPLSPGPTLFAGMLRVVPEGRMYGNSARKILSNSIGFCDEEKKIIYPGLKQPSGDDIFDSLSINDMPLFFNNARLSLASSSLTCFIKYSELWVVEIGKSEFTVTGGVDNE